MNTTMGAIVHTILITGILWFVPTTLSLFVSLLTAHRDEYNQLLTPVSFKIYNLKGVWRFQIRKRR